MVVNIPAAIAEAIDGDKVEQRHVAVVGKPERPSPTLTTTIRAINLNPTWTVPLSIIKKDIMTRMRKDPAYLARMHMRLLDGNGNEIEPERVDWHADRAPNFTIRQDAGAWNSLGALRIDMPNPHSVYMHDTSHKNLFNADMRFHSSGCARVAEPRDLAAWLLQDTEGWGRREIDAVITTGETSRSGSHARFRSPGSISPVGAPATARVHFRADIYGHDEEPPGRSHVSQAGAPVVTAAQGAASSRGPARSPSRSSNLDNR